MTYYKALSRNDKNKLVGYLDNLPNSIIVKYKRRKLNRAKVGKLFIFNEMPTCECDEIWEVKAFGVEKIKRIISPLFTGNIDKVKEFWKTKSYRNKMGRIPFGSMGDIYGNSTPLDGTLVCSSLRLIKRIK